MEFLCVIYCMSLTCESAREQQAWSESMVACFGLISFE